jgi:predicted ABC-type transport system involved in lysophospholipase L1 biosynthesis ATPase subunit
MRREKSSLSSARVRFAGKSTLLQTHAGLLDKPTAGSVRIKNASLRKSFLIPTARACAVTSSASSTSSIICCRSSRRVENVALPQIIAGKNESRGTG